MEAARQSKRIHLTVLSRFNKSGVCPIICSTLYRQQSKKRRDWVFQQGGTCAICLLESNWWLLLYSISSPRCLSFPFTAYNLQHIMVKLYHILSGSKVSSAETEDFRVLFASLSAERAVHFLSGFELWTLCFGGNDVLLNQGINSMSLYCCSSDPVLKETPFVPSTVFGQ